MNDDNDKSRKSRTGGESRWPGTGLAMLLGLLAVAAGLYYFQTSRAEKVDELSYSKFRDLVDEDKIKSAEFKRDWNGGRFAAGEYQKENSAPLVRYQVQLLSDPDTELIAALRAKKVNLRGSKGQPIWQSMLLNFGFLIGLALLVYLFFARQMRMTGKGALSFGKSRARMLTRDKNRVTFKDVAGIDEAREEVQEIIDFLKDPKKFQRLGGRIPKGVLMIGPPGTGKTLLAKAIAGEADVPFFSISGSDFVEMFVGVGASRVRDMFDQGRKNAPCLMFIDEIDAVGRSRFSGIGGGHDEREQTLNALLVEMDGFDTQEGVIIIAATNRPDVLDNALLRPGRFDRQIAIDLPDVNGRLGILKVHTRSVKLDKDVDLQIIARATPGFSGADLANLVNEAALLAARKSKKGVELDDLEEARDKVRWGRERRSRVMDEEDKKITAYHEAGHALAIYFLEGTEPLHKVTIIPRGMFLGATMQLPKKDKHTEGRKGLLGQIAGLMGGRVAEEITFGDITSGAANDIKHATHIARLMVTEWGMSDTIGPVAYGERSDPVFLGRDITRTESHSEAVAQEIDKEVRRIVTDSYERAKQLILQHQDKLAVLAKALLEYETLDADNIREIMTTGKLSSPPPRPLPATPPVTEPTVAPGIPPVGAPAKAPISVPTTPGIAPA